MEYHCENCGELTNIEDSNYIIVNGYGYVVCTPCKNDELHDEDGPWEA